MKYTVTQADPTVNPPGNFVLRDKDGKLIALVLGEDNANVFAHVPELLELLDAVVTENTFYGIAVELREKLKPYRT